MIQKHLIQLASMLLGKNYKDEARQVLKLAQWQDEPDDSDKADWWKDEEKEYRGIPPSEQLDIFEKKLRGTQPKGEQPKDFKASLEAEEPRPEDLLGPLMQYKEYLLMGEYDRARELFETLSPEAKDLAIIEAQRIFAATNKFKKLAHILIQKGYKDEARQVLKLADDAETSEQFKASWEAEEEKKLPQKPKRDLRKEEEDLMEGVRSDLLKMQRREISQEKEVIWDSIEQYKQHLQKGEYDKARELFKTLSPEAQQLATEEAQKIFAAINTFKKLAHILIQSNHKDEARQIINLLRSSNE